MTEKRPWATKHVLLLKKAVEESGLTLDLFARTVLLRNERTLRRWLAGDYPIPAEVRAWLEDGARGRA